MLQVEDDTVGEVGLSGASNPKKRLLGYQKAFIEAMMRTFDSRFKIKRVAVLLREIFDFRRMPLRDWTTLSTYSDAAIDELHGSHFPELDLLKLKSEASAMRAYVARNEKHFIVDGKLKLTGSGSIFEALFTRKDVCLMEIPNILHVADYMISFMWQSCNNERAGSHMNLVKTKERSLLDADTYDDIVFNTMNLPALHEINFDPIIARWKKDGRKSAAFKGQDAPNAGFSRSKVVQRQHSKTTATFLFKQTSNN